jgi:hypothetical protein
MDIATVQKRKFLNNIYKLYYSTGQKPSEQEIRSIFNQYFFTNKLGLPLEVKYNLLQSINITDVDVLNELMASTLLNLDILYECIVENNQEAFSVITALNNKLENLKIKRKNLESKVDQLIFSNNNSDGFYYSYLENFSQTNNIDMEMTTAFIDIDNGQGKIPKITSSLSNALTVDNIISSSALFSVSRNGANFISSKNAENIENAFDGLNDTYWSYDYASSSSEIISLTLEIPLNSGFSISNISGTLLTSSASSVYVKLTSSDANIPDEQFIKNSKKDYNKFSFSVPPRNYTSISITVSKVEPDRIMLDSDSPYLYYFGFREIIIGSEYYDRLGTVVSQPISVPSSDNANLAIASVALEADAQTPVGTGVKYYVAKDESDFSQLSDFNWIPIEPMASGENSFQKIVNLIPSNKNIKYIDTANSDLALIPLNSSSQNVNELNPAALPNSSATVYRVATVDQNEKIVNPFILAGVNCIRNYHIFNLSVIDEDYYVELYKSPEYWAQKIIENNEQELYQNILLNQTRQIGPSINSPANGIMKFSVYSPNDIKAYHDLVKSRDDYNLAVYLNGILIADLPSGRATSSVEWNFLKGINNIIITYDKIFTGLINFNIMSGTSVDTYGTVFLDYFSYLDPIEFRRRITPGVNSFTIDNFYNVKEILASKEISNRSILQYYSVNSDLVTAVRYRVDLERYENPLQTPIIDALRIKFKHSDI